MEAIQELSRSRWGVIGGHFDTEAVDCLIPRALVMVHICEHQVTKLAVSTDIIVDP